MDTRFTLAGLSDQRLQRPERAMRQSVVGHPDQVADQHESE